MRNEIVALTIQVVVAGMLAAGGAAAEPELVVAAKGTTEAVVVVSPEAGLPESKGRDTGHGIARRAHPLDLFECVGYHNYFIH